MATTDKGKGGKHDQRDNRSVDFFFDYLSPYAYLAWLSLPKVCAERNVTINPRPVLFAGLLNYWGHMGPAEIPPKGQHVFKECARFAALAEIPFHSPRYHPFKPLLALRASMKEVAGKKQAEMISAIFKAGWAEGGDLGDSGTIATAIQEAGLDSDEILARTRDPAIKQALHDETVAATQVGVFGIPTMLIEGELFWGLDQLNYIAMFLDGKDPLKTIDITKISSQGRAAVRPASLDRGPEDNSINVELP